MKREQISNMKANWRDMGQIILLKKLKYKSLALKK